MSNILPQSSIYVFCYFEWSLNQWSKSGKGIPINCRANVGYKLIKNMYIWSLSICLSIICEEFSLQHEIQEEIDSYDLCLRNLSTLQVMFAPMLNEYCLRNLCVKSLQVLRWDDSNDTYYLCVVPLNDNGINITNCASSKSRALMIT